VQFLSQSFRASATLEPSETNTQKLKKDFLVSPGTFQKVVLLPKSKPYSDGCESMMGTRKVTIILVLVEICFYHFWRYSRCSSSCSPLRTIYRHQPLPLRIQDGEQATEALMIEFRIPLQFWDFALRSALHSRNLFPLSRNMNSKDGDAPCPWNEAT
jgi:hypothetical protein